MLKRSGWAGEGLRSIPFSNRIKKIVEATPGAIAIDPVGLADVSSNIPDGPRVYSPVIMVTKGAPSPAVQKLIDFVKEKERNTF